jgi:RNA polymerase primary sigma factor
MAVEEYFSNIGEYPLLSREEEKLCATQALLGDEEAKKKLVQSNLRFVVTLALQYKNQGIPLEDLISEGNLGLLTAIEKYDPTKGIKFITYASYWIRQGMLKALSEQNRTVRIPSNRIAQLSRMKTTNKAFVVEYEREPTRSELEECMGETIDASLVSIGGRMGNLDEVNEEGESLLDTLPNLSTPSPEDLMAPEMLKEELTLLLKTLPKRDQDILNLSYGIGTGVNLTFEQIGNIHGISKQRVQQIKKKALNKLRSNPNIGRLRAFM